VILIALAPSIFKLLTNDAAVQAIGIPYLQIRMVGMVGIGMNYAFRGYWNGVGGRPSTCEP